MKLSLSIFVCLSTLLLSACDPSFESTTETCSTNQNEAVRVSFLDLKIKASDDEYQPYLQDMLTALQINETIDTQEQEALNNIDTLIKTFMPYEIITNENGDDEIEATNALDIIESIIATTDPSTVMEEDEFGTVRNVSQLVEAFKLAKQQLADGIDADDGFCIYTNRDIIIENFETQENLDTPDETDTKSVLRNKLYAELRLTYDPFNRTFSQNIIMAQEAFDPEDETQTIVTNFVGFYDTPPTEFKAVGYSPPTVRFGSINDTLGTSSFILDDDFTSEKKLGTIEYLTFDSFCTLKDAEGDTVSHDGDTFVLVGDSLTINSNNQIVINNETLTFSDGTAPTIDTLIKDGVVLDIDDTVFTITDITVVLDENALLINSSTSLTTTENGLSVSVIECADSVQTIEPIKTQCDGGVDDEGNAQTDERNRREARTFNLNTDNPDIKRLRIETDYPANEVRVYISKFRERILDADETQNIETSPFLDVPSECEKQAILDELALLSPGEGVRLTLVPDSGYDFVFVVDENGNPVLDENGAGIIDETQLPTPVYTFTGTEIPTRL